MLTPNRVVAVLTPLVFAPLAGTVAALLAKHFPGVQVDQDQIQAVFIGGAVIALAPAMQWLNGWQKYEAREAGFAHELALAETTAGATDAAVAPAMAEPDDVDADADVVDSDEPLDDDLLGDDDDLLLADEDELGVDELDEELVGQADR